MRPDIILIFPYYMSLDPTQRKQRSPLPPLGLMYIASSLREAGYRVKILDCTFKRPAEAEHELRSLSPRYAGVYTSITLTDQGLKLSRVAKEIGATVIHGGPDISIDPSKYISSAPVDFGVVGEGEETIVELLNTLETKGNPASVRGIAYSTREGVMHYTGFRPPTREPDKFPPPARDLIDNEQYKRVWRQDHGYSLATVFTARGCPYGCYFCTSPVAPYGRRYAGRTPPNIIEELEGLVNKWGFEAIWFVDDVFTVQKRRTLELCQLIRERSIDVQWSCFTRADLVDQELLHEMGRAGCRLIFYGAECLHPDTLIPQPDGSWKKISELSSLSISADFEGWKVTDSVPTAIVEKVGEFKGITISTWSDEITCTPEHRFFTLGEGGLQEKTAKELRVGDIIATVRRLPAALSSRKFEPTIAEILGYFTGDGYADVLEHYSLYRRKDGSIARYPHKRYRVRFSDQNRRVLDYYGSLILATYRSRPRIDKRKGKKSYTLSVTCKPLLQLICKLGLNVESSKKPIPFQVMTSSNEEVARFLRGLYDAEGSVNLRGRLIDLRSSSHDLVLSTKQLLLRLGIPSERIQKVGYTKRGKSYVDYRLRIRNYESAHNFAELVGFNHAEKIWKLGQLLKLMEVSPRQKIDIIPVPRGLLRGMLGELQVQSKGLRTRFHNVLSKTPIHRSTLTRFISELEKLGYQIDSSEMGGWLKKIVEAREIGWSRVRKITRAKMKAVYDLSIPRYENYIAHGFVVHNSGSQKILDMMNRQMDTETVLKAARMTREAGIGIHAFFQIGYPGETYQTIMETIRFLKQLMPDTFSFTMSYPLAGTEFHARVSSFLAEYREWKRPLENRQMFMTDIPEAALKFAIWKASLEFYAHRRARAGQTPFRIIEPAFRRITDIVLRAIIPNKIESVWDRNWPRAFMSPPTEKCFVVKAKMPITVQIQSKRQN